MTTMTQQPEDRWATIKQLWRDEKFLYGMFAGIALIVVGAFVGGALFPNDEGYKTNLYTEFISVITTIVILDRLNERRQRQRETRELKARLIRELGSQVNDVAINAAEELRRHGWLTDGSLKGAILSKANLQGADLEDANLESVNLYQANLQGSDLIDANLQGAKLMGANLSGVDLNYANLQGADLEYANLQGADLEYTNLQGANLYEANLQGADLNYAIFDENTVLPDTKYKIVMPYSDPYSYTNERISKWTPNTDMARYTDPEHDDFWRPEPGSVWWYPEGSSE